MITPNSITVHDTESLTGHQVLVNDVPFISNLSKDKAGQLCALLCYLVEMAGLLHELTTKAAVTWDMDADEATHLNRAWAEIGASLAKNSMAALQVGIPAATIPLPLVEVEIAVSGTPAPATPEPVSESSMTVKASLTLNEAEWATFHEHEGQRSPSQGLCPCLTCRTARMLIRQDDTSAHHQC